ncbi:hypothetical protein [Methylopila turkensis]|uniref:Uncharacterized protein n=1 Tax=Methylopila turkensis TaxID=1437816 RepID=A0A9W6N6J8_9HYPH|nr:hypothetical protein [Methylopila turkensis]GLK79377.1 hypothetical protein GCM10008174_11180 [Methylopila turkensis]
MATAADLAPGQAWSYRGAQLPSSRVVIGRIDITGATTVASVSIVDAPLPDPETGALAPRLVEHAPIAIDALLASLLRREGDAPIPEGFEGGYRVWRNAFDAGQGGFFTLGVEEIVRMFQTALAPQRAAH